MTQIVLPIEHQVFLQNCEEVGKNFVFEVNGIKGIYKKRELNLTRKEAVALFSRADLENENPPKSLPSGGVGSYIFLYKLKEGDFENFQPHSVDAECLSSSWCYQKHNKSANDWQEEARGDDRLFVAYCKNSQMTWLKRKSFVWLAQDKGYVLHQYIVTKDVSQEAHNMEIAEANEEIAEGNEEMAERNEEGATRRRSKRVCKKVLRSYAEAEYEEDEVPRKKTRAPAKTTKKVSQKRADSELDREIARWQAFSTFVDEKIGNSQSGRISLLRTRIAEDLHKMRLDCIDRVEQMVDEEEYNDGLQLQQPNIHLEEADEGTQEAEHHLDRRPLEPAFLVKTEPVDPDHRIPQQYNDGLQLEQPSIHLEEADEGSQETENHHDRRPLEAVFPVKTEPADPDHQINQHNHEGRPLEPIFPVKQEPADPALVD